MFYRDGSQGSGRYHGGNQIADQMRPTPPQSIV